MSERGSFYVQQSKPLAYDCVCDQKQECVLFFLKNKWGNTMIALWFSFSWVNVSNIKKQLTISEKCFTKIQKGRGCFSGNFIKYFGFSILNPFQASVSFYNPENIRKRSLLVYFCFVLFYFVLFRFLRGKTKRELRSNMGWEHLWITVSVDITA